MNDITSHYLTIHTPCIQQSIVDCVHWIKKVGGKHHLLHDKAVIAYVAVKYLSEDEYIALKHNVALQKRMWRVAKKLYQEHVEGIKL